MKSLITYLMTGTAIFIFTQGIYLPTSKTSVGDVTYSVLEPDSFYKLHNVEKEKWVLMDGRPIDNSQLAALGIKQIADARGLFVRAMDMGRYKESKGTIGDPDAPRNIALPQMDGFKTHEHGIYHVIGWAEGDKYGLELMLRARPGDDKNITTVGGSGGISETRPQNIALYLYIRIN